ncbi:unnamed protein product [Closterium sp. NIES-53]
MASHTLVSGLPWSLPPLPPGPAPTCVPCVEGRQSAAPHSSEFPPTEAPLQTLHMDVWGPARVNGQGHERYFQLVVEDYSRYTTVFPLRQKGEVIERWGVLLRTSEGLLSCGGHPPDVHAFGLPTANGIAERRIGMCAAHQINLQPHVSLPETTPTLRWTGKVGDASQVWGSQAFVRDTSEDKLSSRAVPCVFLGFPPNAPGWQFYHPTSRRVLSFQDVTFDESVSYYHLFPYRTASLPPPALLPRTSAARGAEPERVEPGGAERGGVESRAPLSAAATEWYARRCSRAAGATGPAAGGASGAGAAGGAADAGAARAAGAGGTGAFGGPTGVGAVGGTGAAGHGGARTGGIETTGAGGAARVGVVGAGAVAPRGAAAAGAVGTGAVAIGGAAGAGAIGGTGAGGAAGVVAGDPGAEGPGAVSAPASPLPGPSPYSGPTRGLTERRESKSRPTSPESHPASPESRLGSPARAVCTGRRVPRQRPPPIPSTHSMTLRPSTAPQRVPLPSTLGSSLPDDPDPESDSLRATCPTLSRILATAVTDPSFESTAASALVAELLDFAAACRLDYTTSLVAESGSTSVCPPSVAGECALGTDDLEDRHEEFECFAASLPHLVSMLLAPEGDLDAPDILTTRSYAEAIEGPYSSQWQTAMDIEMASWKSKGTDVDEVPPLGANIVSGMWIFRMTTLRVLLHVSAQHDYELHSLDFSTAFLQGSLHEEIWLRCPPGFTGSFPSATQWSLRRPVYGLRQAPCEWHDTLRTTLAALGFAPSIADPSLFLRTDTTLPPFYVLVYVDDLVFAIADIEALAHMKSELQKRHTCTDLAPPSDESVELSGPYPELVGCLIHRKEHMDAAKRVLRYLCTTSGMGLMLGGRAQVVLTGHADASWVDDLATQWSSQGYTFSLGSGSVSWRSTRLSSILSSSCEAEIYAGAMAAQELHWLTYLLTDLGEAPRSPPQRGQLRLAYVTTQANTADIFTKALQPCDHLRFCTMLGRVPTWPHLLTS